MFLLWTYILRELGEKINLHTEDCSVVLSLRRNLQIDLPSHLSSFLGHFNCFLGWLVF